MILIWVFTFHLVKGEEIKCNPIYEMGAYLGVVTDPMSITTQSGEKGEIGVGYVKIQKVEALYFRILPGSELYDAMFPMMEQIMQAKLVEYENNPQSMGLFLPGSRAYGEISNLRIDLTLGDDKNYWVSASKSRPTMYNLMSVLAGEDMNYVPFQISLPVEGMIEYGTSKDCKFKFVEKFGVKNLKIYYGENIWEIPLDFMTADFIKMLEKAWKRMEE